MALVLLPGQVSSMPQLSLHGPVPLVNSTMAGSPQGGSTDPALLFRPSNLLLLSSRVSHRPLVGFLALPSLQRIPRILLQLK